MRALRHRAASLIAHLHAIVILILVAFVQPVFGTDYDPADASALTTALAAVACGDTIRLDAGVTYTGNFTMRNAGDCTANPITLTTDTPANVPAVGTRLCVPLTVTGHAEQNITCGVDHSASMPIIAAVTTPLLKIAKLARGYRIIGVRFSYTYTATTSGAGTMIFMGYESDDATMISVTGEIPDQIYFEHVYLHGTSTGGVQRALLMNAKNFTLRDSVVREIHATGSQTNAIAVWNSPGPFSVINNEIFTAATQGLLSGGATPGVTNQVHCDWVITQNHFSRPRTAFPGDASYAGIAWTVANQLEFKNGCDGEIYHNIFEYTWASAQLGTLVAWTGLNDQGTCTWCTVEFMTFQNNIVRHGNAGFAASGRNCYDPCVPATQMPPASNDLIIRNNLFYDLSHLWNDGSGCSPDPCGSGVGRFGQISGQYDNVTVDHNTAQQVNTGSMSILFSLLPGDGLGTYAKAANPIIRDNFFWRGYYGVTGDGEQSCGVEGTGTLDSCSTGYTFSTNVIADNSGRGDTPPSSPAYPATTTFITSAAWDAIFTAVASGDYRVLAGSVYKAGGASDASDGTDMGVNMCNGAFPDPAGRGNTTFSCSGVDTKFRLRFK